MKRVLYIFLCLIGATTVAYGDYYYLTYNHTASNPTSSKMTGITGSEKSTITAPAANAITNVTITGLNLSNYQSKHNSQTITNFKYNYTTAPTNTNVTTDTRGNGFTAATWANINANASVSMTSTYTAETNVTIPAFKPTDAYPRTGALPAAIAEYVNSTTKIQSGDATIIAQAETIISGSKTIYEAVTKVGKWIYENITYDATVNQDASSVLASKKGNCEGFSNLTIALLRAKGIPARICGGLLLNKAQTLTVGTGGSVTIGSSGPGWHAIYEVYYPSLAVWVGADAQSSVHFSTNHTLVWGKGRDESDCKVRTCSYQSTGGAAIWAAPDIKTTVTTITGGYTYDGMSTIKSTKGGVLLSVKELSTPGGMEDAIYITAGPRVIGPYDTVTYTGIFDDANFSGDYADYWDWSIDLFHNGGIYTLASDFHVYGHSQHTWGKKLAGLPVGYKWKRNANGNIIGSVTLKTIDNDNYPHSSTIPIEMVSYIGPFTVTGSTENRPNSFDVQGTDGADMVYHLQLSQASVFDVSFCNTTTNYDAKVEVFKADRSTTNYYNDDDALCASNSYLSPGLHNVSLAAGDYYIAVDGYNGYTGSLQMQVTYAPAGSQTIAGLPFTHRGTTTSQTNKWDVQNTDGADAEYSVTFALPSCLKISTCASYTNYNTMLEIFKSDRTRANVYNNDYTCSSGGTKATINNGRVATGQYYVVVDGSGGATGNYELQVGYGYDYTVGNLPYTHSGTTSGKKNDWDVMYGDGEDVTYLLDLQYATPLDISLCGTGTKYDTKIEIFKETGVTTGYYNDDDYSCTANTLSSSLRGVVLSPGKYFIVVDGYNGAVGNYALRVSAATALAKQVALSKTAAVNAMKGNYQTELAKMKMQADNSAPVDMDIPYLVYELQKRMNGGNAVIAAVESDEGGRIGPEKLNTGLPQDFAIITTGLTRGQIRYALPQEANVEIALYSLNGSLVKLLTKGKIAAGLHTLDLSSMSARNGKVAIGHYVCRMKAGNRILTNKILLSK
jgi:transglutaminase-like putative cysteine protease